MTVNVYKSTDVGAPVLAHANSSLINLLKACLVNGYGSKAAAGWTNPFNGTNLAVFRSAATSNQRYLQVKDDEGSSAYSYRIARLRGFEDMTDVSTGTGPFPTVAQQANSIGCSYGRTTFMNDWVLIATDKIFHFVCNKGAVAIPDNYGAMISFGDIKSFTSGDIYSTILRADSDSGASPYAGYVVSSLISTTPSDYVYMPRKFDGTGTSIRCTFVTSGSLNNSGSFGYGAVPYPNGPDNGLLMSELAVAYNASAPIYIRGMVPGLYDICHNKPVAHKDTWSGAAGSTIAGKTFLAFSASPGQLALEVSDTW